MINKDSSIHINPGCSWTARSLSEIQRVTVPLTFKSVNVYNRTKTCTAYFGMDEGELFIIIENPDDEVFRFERNTDVQLVHCMICGGTSDLHRYRIPLDPPCTVLMHHGCAENLKPRKETDVEEEKETEPTAGDHEGTD